jgi:hypothetical protein
MKWVAIALALLLLASGIFWLGRTATPSGTPSGTPAANVKTHTPDPVKAAVPAAVEAAPPPETHPGGPASAPMDAVPAPDAAMPAPPPKPKPKTLAELDTPTLIRRAISNDDLCSNGGGNLDQTGQACAMRDRIEAILNTRGYCHTSGEVNWQRCAQ